MDPTKLRMRYLIGIFLAAVLTAAFLRHTIHTYGGYSREDIRSMSLEAIATVVLFVIIFVGLRRRRK